MELLKMKKIIEIQNQRMDLTVNRIEERINELDYGGKLYQMQLRETEIEK